MNRFFTRIYSIFFGGTSSKDTGTLPEIRLEEVNPLLAKRVTELEASMAELACAHADALRERTVLESEMQILRNLDADRPGATTPAGSRENATTPVLGPILN